jgi:hypothetical protein
MMECTHQPLIHVALTLTLIFQEIQRKFRNTPQIINTNQIRFMLSLFRHKMISRK